MGTLIIVFFILSIIDTAAIIILDCFRGRLITYMEKSEDENFKKSCVKNIIRIDTLSSIFESMSFVLLIILFTVIAVSNK